MKTLSAHSILCFELLTLFGLSGIVYAQSEPRSPQVQGALRAVRVTNDQSQSVLPRQDLPRETLSDYSLSSGDLVDIKVFQEDDLESKVRISDQGTITFPLVGVVRIGGLTSQGASEALRAALKRYLVNPQVNVIVTEYSKRRFTVLGQVQKPGSYEMPDRDAITLLQAIGIAGGYTPIADPSKIVLKRAGNRSDQVIKINASRMAKDDSVVAMQVLPGDVISVGESIF